MSCSFLVPAVWNGVSILSKYSHIFQAVTSYSLISKTKVMSHSCSSEVLKVSYNLLFRSSMWLMCSSKWQTHLDLVCGCWKNLLTMEKLISHGSTLLTHQGMPYWLIALHADIPNNDSSYFGSMCVWKQNSRILFVDWDHEVEVLSIEETMHLLLSVYIWHIGQIMWLKESKKVNLSLCVTKTTPWRHLGEWRYSSMHY
jgi:hypothetical protein